MASFLTSLDQAGVSLGVVAVVFLASALQSVTGIGFGVIAGPILLVAMGSATAIQVSIVLSFLIAFLLAPRTLPRVNARLLWPLMVGICIGTPFGALAILALPIDALKMMAALVVGFMTLVAAGVFARYPVFQRDSRIRRIAVGAISGALNTALAMPGPAIAAYATAIKSDMETIRATTLVSFLFAYPVGLLFQYIFVGLSPDLVAIAMPLAIPTLLGSFAGILLSGMFSSRVFRLLTLFFLAASVCALIFG